MRKPIRDVAGRDQWFPDVQKKCERLGLVYDAKAVGWRLAQIRYVLGFKQKEFALAQNISPQTWNDYEVGKSKGIPFKVLEAMIALLPGVEANWILYGREDFVPRCRLEELAAALPEVEAEARQRRT